MSIGTDDDPVMEGKELKRHLRMSKGIDRLLHMTGVESMQDSMMMEKALIAQQAQADHKLIYESPCVTPPDGEAQPKDEAMHELIDEDRDVRQMIAGDFQIIHNHPERAAPVATTPQVTSPIATPTPLPAQPPTVAPPAAETKPANGLSTLAKVAIGSGLVLGGAGAGVAIEHLFVKQPTVVVPHGKDTQTDVAFPRLPPQAQPD